MMWARSGGHRAGETVIGASTLVRGRLQSSGSVSIQGRFEGEIETDGDVIVGAGGELVADIRARNVLVGGLVEGDVRADGRLEILATGRLEGDVSARGLIIAEGAAFLGRSTPLSTTGADMRPMAVPLVAGPLPAEPMDELRLRLQTAPEQAPDS